MVALVNSAVFQATGTVLTLGFTPAANNVLLVVANHRSGGSMVPTAPGSWTALKDYAGGASQVWCVGAKVAVGNETTITVPSGGSYRVGVYELSGTKLALLSAVVVNDADIHGGGAAYGCGNIVGAAGGTGFYLFAAAVNDDTQAAPGFSELTAGYTTDLQNTGGFAPQSIIAHRLTSGTQAPTVKWTRGDVFDVPAEAIGIVAMPPPGRVQASFVG